MIKLKIIGKTRTNDFLAYYQCLPWALLCLVSEGVSYSLPVLRLWLSRNKAKPCQRPSSGNMGIRHASWGKLFLS